MGGRVVDIQTKPSQLNLEASGRETAIMTSTYESNITFLDLPTEPRQQSSIARSIPTT